MNTKFHDISLAVGGAYYPTVNPHLQQRFGEIIVQHVVDRIDTAITHSEHNSELVATLQSLRDQIVRDFQ
jgi:hypothetical protein